MQSLEVPVHTSRLVALLKKPTAAAGGGMVLGEVKQEKPRCVRGYYACETNGADDMCAHGL